MALGDPHHLDRPVMHPVEARHRARQLAKEAGQHTFTWTPCSQGHTTYSVKSGTCEKCRILALRNQPPGNVRKSSDPTAIAALQKIAERNLVTK